MKTLGYYNGEIGEIEDMTIPMNDRANYFGDGVYDATVCVGYAINFLEEHVDRFYRSAAALGIVIPCAKNDLCALLRDLYCGWTAPISSSTGRSRAAQRRGGTPFPPDRQIYGCSCAPKHRLTPAKPTAWFRCRIPGISTATSRRSISSPRSWPPRRRRSMAATKRSSTGMALLPNAHIRISTS